MDAHALFEAQVDALIDRGYAGLAGMTDVRLRRRLGRLRHRVETIKGKAADLEKGRLPFVIVVTREVVPIEATMPLVSRQGKTGHIAMQPVDPSDFTPISGVVIPKSGIYLLVDVNRGQESLNVRPEDALKEIRRKRRSPLTIEEGIAIVTHFPDFLQKNNCFSLLASRRADQRVPAIWIDGTKRPKLGWCWDRNPHTWLGSASAKRRIDA